MANNEKHTNGKGSKPRSCFSKNFKENYDLISWEKKKKMTCAVCQGREWVKDFGEYWLCPICHEKVLTAEVFQYRK